MNWDAIGAIGEMIGAAAVVASLLYLALQTRANAKALRANAIWDSETIFGTVNYSHGSNPEWAGLLGRATEPGAVIGDFSPIEQSQMQFTFRGALQYYQAQWSLSVEGLVPGELWDRRRKSLRSFIETPVFRQLWEEEIRQHTVPVEFRRIIEATELEGETSFGRFSKDE